MKNVIQGSVNIKEFDEIISFIISKLEKLRAIEMAQSWGMDLSKYFRQCLRYPWEFINSYKLKRFMDNLQAIQKITATLRFTKQQSAIII